MKVNTICCIEEKTDIEQEVSRFGLTVIIAMASLIGLWGTACLIGGLSTNGLGSLLAGLRIAITGF